MKVVGIVGIPSCGSTLLSFVLGSSKEVFATGELRDLVNNQFNVQCRVCWEDCVFWTSQFIEECKSNVGKIPDLVKERANKMFGSNIIINSDKDICCYMKYLENKNQIDDYVLLFKRPEGFVYSAKVHSCQREEHSLKYYSEEYTQALSWLRGKPHVCIFYDDFASNPGKIAKLFCDRYGIKYDSTMLNFADHKNKFHTLAGNPATYVQVVGKDNFKGSWDSPNNSQYIIDYESWVNKNFGKIALDERWKTHLTLHELEFCKGHSDSQKVFARLMEERTT